MSSSLTNPWVKVTPAGEEPIVVQILNPDMIRWERERAKRRWPESEDAPIMWITFVAWSAARREKAIPEDLPYAKWEETIQTTPQMVDADGNPIDDLSEVEPTDPIDRGLDPG